MLDMETVNQACRDLSRLARAAFDSYNESVGGLTWDGKPIPPWSSLTPKIRRAWCASVIGAIAEVNSEMPGSDSRFIVRQRELILSLIT